jgi:hypothetical protein
MRRAVITLRAVIALSALLMLAACGPSTPSTTSHAATATASTSHSATATAGALGAVCPNLATINHSLTSLSNVTAATTVGEVQATHSSLTSALDRLVVAVPSNTAPTLTTAQTASNQLATTLKGYPATATMGQTGIDLHALTSKAAAAQVEVAHLASTLKCPA